MLSKTTINFANARNLDVTDEYDNGIAEELVWVWELSNDNEPIFLLISNVDGSFTWYKNIYLPTEIATELPSHIRNEKHLREVLNFVSIELIIAEATI